MVPSQSNTHHNVLKTSVKVEQGLVQINNTVKKITHASPTAIKSSMLSAGITNTGYEMYEYGTSKKQLNNQNLMNSAAHIGKEAIVNGITTNAGLISGTIISSSTDYLYSNETNLNRNISSSLASGTIDNHIKGDKNSIGYNFLKIISGKLINEYNKED